jgi:mannosyltransferase
VTRLPWRWSLALCLIILAAFALRLCRLDFQDIWWDEARNVDVATRALSQIATAPELDIHPPVYFYLLHGWLAMTGAKGMRLLGQSAFAARFMSLWFGVLLVPLMDVLGRRVAGRWAGLGAALGAAFLPFLLGEAQETRMYTVTLVWLACAAVALLGTGDRGQGSIVSRCLPWLLFALFSALALLTHYAAVFALVVLWGWAVGWALFGVEMNDPETLDRKEDDRKGRPYSERWRRLPGLPVALRQIPSYRNPNLVVPPVGGYLAELARVYGLGEHLDPSAAQPWVWALAGWLVVGWLLAIASQRRGKSAKGPIGKSTNQRIGESRAAPFAIRHSTFAIAWAIVPLVVYYLVIHDRATFASRYISFALPGWFLLGGLALRGWASLGRWAGALAAAALVIVLAPGLRGDLLDSRFFREDTRGLVAWLEAETGPDDLILVDQRYPFGFYYERWNNAPDGSPPSEPADLAPAQYLFVDINTVGDRLTALAKNKRRVYWVRWFESDTDPRDAVSFLLEKFGTLLGERAFRGYGVSWYEIAPDAQFELAQSLANLQTDFGDQVRLTGAAYGGRGPGITSDVAATRLPQGPADKPVWATLRWARLPDARQPLKATLVLEDSGGTVVGRDDRPILNDRHLAPDRWSETDRPLGAYLIQPDPATPPGTYALKLAVYDPATLAQLPASGHGAAGSFVTLGQVELTQAAGQVSPDRLSIDAPIEAAWQGVRLLGRGPLPTQLNPGDRLALDLYWQAEKSDLPEMQVRLSLTPVGFEAPDGVSLSHEAPPVPGYPTTQWANGEVLRGRQRWQIDPGVPAGEYRLTLQLVERDGLASPPVELGQVAVAGRSHTFEQPAAMDVRSGATFGDFALLWGYDARPSPSVAMDGSASLAMTPGSPLTATLHWQAEGASTLPYAVSLQLLDANGVLRAQHDQQPAAGAAPTTGWAPGEVVADSYRLELPADLAPGHYTLVLRMYDPATLAVLPATAADGKPGSDSLVLATVEVR